MTDKLCPTVLFAWTTLVVLCGWNTARAQVRLGTVWEEVPGNPALAPESCYSWNCAGVTDPTLVINPDRSISTWFTTVGIGIRSDKNFSDGPYFGRSNGVLGRKMEYSPRAPIVSVGAERTWDKYLETPSVRRNPDSTLTMWYMGHPAFGIQDSALGQMNSSDAAGTRWIRPAAPIYRPAPGAWDSSLSTGPTVVRSPNGAWYLYYSGVGTTGTQGIGLLTSKDGVTWAPYGVGPVLPSQPGAWDSDILEQSALYFKGQFWMWYSGYRGPLDLKSTSIAIGLATSADGIVWTRYSKNPVIRPGSAGSWDDLRVLAPDVAIQTDGSLLMTAYGVSRTDKVAGSIGFWRSLP